jgi:hypothetical protein
VHYDLCRLLETTQGQLYGFGAATDLAEAVAHWNAEVGNQSEARRREEHRDLLRQARDDIDHGGEQSDGDDDSESDDEID